MLATAYWRFQTIRFDHILWLLRGAFFKLSYFVPLHASTGNKKVFSKLIDWLSPIAAQQEICARRHWTDVASVAPNGVHEACEAHAGL